MKVTILIKRGRKLPCLIIFMAFITIKISNIKYLTKNRKIPIFLRITVIILIMLKLIINQTMLYILFLRLQLSIY